MVFEDKDLVWRSWPDDLGGEGEPRPLLARGDGERLSFPTGLTEGAGRWTCFRGGVVDILFTSFLGERETEELLPEDEAERDRLLKWMQELNDLGRRNLMDWS